MTICFTLPYSSGGCEERRIKFDLLTAIIKCSLLASIKARRLMLTWLTLMQPQDAGALPFFFTSFILSPFFFFFCTYVCVCVTRVRQFGVSGNARLLMGHYLFCILADGKTQIKMTSFFVLFVVTKSACWNGAALRGKLWNLLFFHVSPDQQIWIPQRNYDVKLCFFFSF